MERRVVAYLAIREVLEYGLIVAALGLVQAVLPMLLSRVSPFVPPSAPTVGVILGILQFVPGLIGLGLWESASEHAGIMTGLARAAILTGLSSSLVSAIVVSLLLVLVVIQAPQLYSVIVEPAPSPVQGTYIATLFIKMMVGYCLSGLTMGCLAAVRVRALPAVRDRSSDAVHRG